MSKLFVIAALAFALAAGTVIDAVTIAQAAHAECISKSCLSNSGRGRSRSDAPPGCCWQPSQPNK